MQVDPDQLSRPAAKSLEDIKHLKVGNSNPPTSTNEALDVDRCSALHNAIIKHQWQASGRDLAALPQKTWWDSEQFADQLDSVGKNLPECLVEFLQRALHPRTHLDPDTLAGNMFYLSLGLAAPQTLWRELGEEMGDGYHVALYLTDYEISETRRLMALFMILMITAVSSIAILTTNSLMRRTRRSGSTLRRS